MSVLPSYPEAERLRRVLTDKEIGKSIGAFLGMSGITSDDVARIRELVGYGAPAQTVQVPVEVRKQDDTIDEIIIRGPGVLVHIEQMSADGWFMGVNAADGSYWQFWFGAKNRKSRVEFRHTEMISAEEETARRSPELSSTEGK